MKYQALKEAAIGLVAAKPGDLSPVPYLDLADMFRDEAKPQTILRLLEEREALVRALEFLSDASRYDHTVTGYARAALLQAEASDA